MPRSCTMAHWGPPMSYWSASSYRESVNNWNRGGESSNARTGTPCLTRWNATTSARRSRSRSVSRNRNIEPASRDVSLQRMFNDLTSFSFQPTPATLRCPNERRESGSHTGRVEATLIGDVAQQTRSYVQNISAHWSELIKLEEPELEQAQEILPGSTVALTAVKEEPGPTTKVSPGDFLSPLPSLSSLSRLSSHV